MQWAGPWKEQTASVLPFSCAISSPPAGMAAMQKLFNSRLMGSVQQAADSSHLVPAPPSAARVQKGHLILLPPTLWKYICSISNVVPSLHLGLYRDRDKGINMKWKNCTNIECVTL